MTEPTEPTPTEPAPEAPDADDTAVDDSTLDPRVRDSLRKLRSENKNLRTRLRSTETDLESAATRLAAAEHAEVERIAGEVLIDPTDVWTAQSDMAQFYDDEFQQITADKVVAAAKELAAAKPHLARPAKSPPPTDRPLESLRGGAAPEVKPTTPSWAAAIHGRGR